jgi:hypothetical protein
MRVVGAEFASNLAEVLPCVGEIYSPTIQLKLRRDFRWNEVNPEKAGKQADVCCDS